MKYLEEIDIGECFCFDKKIYILTEDFKKNGDKKCVNLKDGNQRWISSSSIIEVVDIYTLDKDSTISPIRERKNEYKTN